MIVYRFYLNQQPGYVVPAMGLMNFLSELSDLEIGDELAVRPIEMTEEEFKKLPEFQGW